ncbi:hypothetical protein [Paenibacillus alvei]|nr:hypothetical protein [Paenibacillus alvei]
MGFWDCRLIGPFFEANPIGALVCVLANADKKRLMTWQMISVAA